MKHDLDPELDLILEREVDVPPARVWAAWTRPEHLVKWFTPAPWSTTRCEIDLRPGGKFLTVMRSPEVVEHENVGCWLEIVEQRRLTWTDALLPGWRPAGQAFMTATILLEATSRGTRCTAIARHADPEKRAQHEAMGFHGGWGTALDQLVAHMR
jgi:uncharacterized protein YndB with AHSA1/START domain